MHQHQSDVLRRLGIVTERFAGPWYGALWTALLFLPICMALLAGCSQDATSREPITTWNGETLNAFQLSVVGDDGVVTEAELKDAYERARQCIEDEGWEADIVDDAFGEPGLNVVTWAKDNNGEAAVSAMHECEAEWVGQLKSIYLVSHAPTGAAREAEFEEFRQCIESAGGKTDGIYLGQPQGEMVARIEELSGPFMEWPTERTNCIYTYYVALWPELIGAQG